MGTYRVPPSVADVKLRRHSRPTVNRDLPPNPGAACITIQDSGEYSVDPSDVFPALLYEADVSRGEAEDYGVAMTIELTETGHVVYRLAHGRNCAGKISYSPCPA